VKRSHVVVAGYGMAGSRLVEELRRRDPDASRLTITMIGAEPVPAYNRVLLSSVLAGSLGTDAISLHDDGWAARHGIDHRLGVSVSGIDRATRRVRLSTGESVSYDALVLATGSRPWIPPAAGLTSGGELAPSVLAFQSLADCELIIKSVSAGAPVAVLGGGVLGIEAAHALSTRTTSVTVVHPMDWVMERQLDRDGGKVLNRLLESHGIRIRLGRFATRIVPGEGLNLDDGSHVPAAQVILAAGVRPETSLAVRAGLTVDRGVGVDDTLRTSDGAIFAIGDCAQHHGAPSGFVQPAWEQAEVLADLLSGAAADSRYRGTPVIARLKARGIELTAMGDAQIDVHTRDDEVVALTDPARGRYAKLVLRNDLVKGAVFLGLPRAAAIVGHHFHTGSPVRTDRAALLLGTHGDHRMSTEDVLSLPESTTVCRCNNVRLGTLLTAWRRGARSVSALAEATGGTTGCGGCTGLVEALVGAGEHRDAPSDEGPGEADGHQHL
jgi:assimilatory nitrate reductase electron transfer subunit